MALISSHVLDSTIGTHAAGIQVECYQLDKSGSRSIVFNCVADEQGRISESVQLVDGSVEYELVFHSKFYFQNKMSSGTAVGSDDNRSSGEQIMNAVVVRLTLSDDAAKYHVPIMLAPHSYSIWWSDTTRNTH